MDANQGSTLAFPFAVELDRKNQSKSYPELGSEIGELVVKKQAAYGDSFGKAGRVLRELYPNGISPEQMDDALTVVRVVDKLFRIATDRDALGESPWWDIAGYALLSVKRQADQQFEVKLPRPVCSRCGKYHLSDECR